MFEYEVGRRNDAYHDLAEERYTRSRRSHWNNFAQTSDSFRGAGGHYHRRLAQIYQFLVTPGQNVLEIGCGTGDLLAALKPASGVGVDFSEEILIRANAKHPELQFVQMNAHDLTGLDAYTREPFDIIILSDLLNDVWDIQTILDQLVQFSGTKTRVIINSYSRLWEIPLAVAEKLGLARPVLYQSWLTVRLPLLKRKMNVRCERSY